MCALVTGVQTCALPISRPIAAISQCCARTSASKRSKSRTVALPTNAGGNANRISSCSTRTCRYSTVPAAHVAFAKPKATERIAAFRSEEHTSELQSLMRTSYAVFCLKKKKHQQTQNTAQAEYQRTHHIHTQRHDTPSI